MKKRRHVLTYKFAKWLIAPFIKKKMNYSGDYVDVGSRPTLVMCNHTTDVDPMLLGVNFKQHMYMVASEHIFRWGVASSLLKFFLGPIPRYKGKVEVNTARQILSYLKDGENICIFPEGSMSMDGVSMDIIPSTGKLVKLSRADLVTYRITGGYLTSPRWAENLRKGKMKGSLVGKYSAEELKDMSPEEINDIISRDIFVDAYAVQKVDPVSYKGENLAEFLEKVFFLCPKCKQLGTIKSKGNDFSCSCGLKGTYTEMGYLEGEELEFSTVSEWTKWQYQFMKDYIDTLEEDAVICSDEDQLLYELEPCVKTKFICSGTMVLTREALKLGDYVFPIKEIVNLARCSKLKLTFSTVKGENYEIDTKKMRSAFKYQSIVNILKGKSEHAPY